MWKFRKECVNNWVFNLQFIYLIETISRTKSQCNYIQGFDFEFSTSENPRTWFCYDSNRNGEFDWRKINHYESHRLKITSKIIVRNVLSALPFGLNNKICYFVASCLFSIERLTFWIKHLIEIIHPIYHQGACVLTPVLKYHISKGTKRYGR